MDDGALGVAIGLLVAFAFHGTLHSRAGRAAERQMRDEFSSSGNIHAVVHEQIPFGLFANDIRSLDLYCSHVSSDRLPFHQVPRAGWKGKIDHLRLHIKDSDIAGVRITSIEADIPGVRYDLGHALYKDRLFIRQAGEGSVKVLIDQTGLTLFALQKYSRTLRHVNVLLSGDRLTLSGDAMIFSSAVPFIVTGKLVPRDGMFVDVTQAAVTLNGRQLDDAEAQDLLSRINPVLDVDKDMHMGQFIRVDDVQGLGSQLVIHGRITIPVEPIPTQNAKTSQLKVGQVSDALGGRLPCTIKDNENGW